MLEVFKRATVCCLLLSLFACGGSDDNYVGGYSPTPETPETPNNPIDERVVDLEITSNARQMPSDGKSSIIISAIAKDLNNNVINDTDVTFAVDSGATIDPVEEDAGNAVKTAVLIPGLNQYTNRTVTVTVKAGNQERNIPIDVVGTTITLAGPPRVALNTPTRYVMRLVDSSGNGIPHKTLEPVSAKGNTIAMESRTTDQLGEVSFYLTALSSGNDQISASVLGALHQTEIEVSSENFLLSSESDEIPLNNNETINLSWFKEGLAQNNRLIHLSVTRGNVLSTNGSQVNSVTTDSNGQARFMLSSSSAGSTVITATDAQSGLSTILTREFIAVEPRYISLQADQSLLSPGGETRVYAVVRDTNDNPVKNKLVRFKVTDAINGVLNTSTGKTNSLGQVSVTYTAGNASSAQDGVRIDVELLDHPDIKDSLFLTVGSRAFSIVLGADEKIVEEAPFYKKQLGVIVTDNAGNPVKDKLITFQIIPVQYYKGEIHCNGVDVSIPLPNGTTVQGSGRWENHGNIYSCDAEDTNNNGQLDYGEDYNYSGRLEPRIPITIKALSGSMVTDAEGKLSVVVTYPQSHAWWTLVRIIATVRTEGTEAYASSLFQLAPLSSDVKDCAIEPPNRYSPWGLERCEVPPE